MSTHLGPKAPLRLHLRHAFHDWMWSGGSRYEIGRIRALCRRLPLYFTDPYLDGVPRTMAEFEAMKPEPTHGPPKTVHPTGSLLVDFTTGKVTPMPQTWGAAATFTYRLP